MKLFLYSILFLAAHVCSAQHMVEGKVIRIADGDSFTLLDATNKQLKIRLHGVDCPERGQDFYQVAKSFTSAHLFNKSIRVEVLDKDHYGRFIAKVWLNDSLSLNLALLQAGLAWHYTAYDKSANFAAAQEMARKQSLHIWSLSNTIAPWEFRKAKRTKAAQKKAA